MVPGRVAQHQLKLRLCRGGNEIFSGVVLFDCLPLSALLSSESFSRSSSHTWLTDASAKYMHTQPWREKPRARMNNEDILEPDLLKQHQEHLPLTRKLS